MNKTKIDSLLNAKSCIQVYNLRYGAHCRQSLSKN